MANVSENALIILRIMVDVLKLSTYERVQTETLIPQTNLDKDSFMKAAFYLSQRKFATTDMNYISWKLTAEGVAHLESIMSLRLPLSLDAERILVYCEDNLNLEQKDVYARDLVLNALGLEEREYTLACRKLESFGLIKDSIFGNYEFIHLLEKGKQAVHDNFRRQDAPNTQINAGAIIGEMKGGTVQAVAAAYESQIQQIINQTDADSLRKGINEAIEKLVNDVTAHLAFQQKAAYMQVAVELQQEIAKPNPDRSVIERLMKVLSFGDSLGGTLELGDKLFTMLGKAAPYIGLIAPAIDQLYHSLPK